MPILLVTGYASGDLDLTLPQLTKPFRQNELAEALAQLWQRHSAACDDGVA